MSLEPTTAQPSGSSSGDRPTEKRAPILPDFFCGNADQRWQDWLSDFELFNSLNHWSDAGKVNFIGIRLKGAPRDVYRSLMGQEKSSYDRLKTALTERFEPLDRTEVFRTEFRWRVKREGERLLDFGMAMASAP